MKRLVHAALLGLCAPWLLACSGVQHKPASGLDALFVAADLARVRALTPDFLERAEAVRRSARNEANAERRADDERRAALLLRAAIVEADRIELDRKAAAAERRNASAVAATALASAARRAAEDELARIASEQREESGSEAAFAEVLAASACEASTTLQCRDVRKRAAAFLLRRARLTSAAAQALGADAAALEEASGKRLAAEATLTGEAVDLASAQAAFAAALSALGAARAKAARCSGEAAHDLLARAHELGLSAVAEPCGVVITLGELFVPASSELRRRALPLLRFLRALLAAYPCGDIRIDAHARGRSSAMRKPTAQKRSARVRAFLATTLQSERLVTQPVVESALPDDEQATLFFSGYASSSTP